MTDQLRQLIAANMAKYLPVSTYDLVQAAHIQYLDLLVHRPD